MLGSFDLETFSLGVILLRNKYTKTGFKKYVREFWTAADKKHYTSNFFTSCTYLLADKRERTIQTPTILFEIWKGMYLYRAGQLFFLEGLDEEILLDIKTWVWIKLVRL